MKNTSKKTIPKKPLKKTASKKITKIAKAKSGQTKKSVNQLVEVFHQQLRTNGFHMQLSNIVFKPTAEDNCPCGKEWYWDIQTNSWQQRCAICE